MSAAELGFLIFAALCFLALLLLLALWRGTRICPHCGTAHPDYGHDRRGGYQPCPNGDQLGGPPLFP